MVNTLKFAIAKIWQEIPTNMKTPGYFQFNKYYKTFLSNSQ